MLDKTIHHWLWYVKVFTSQLWFLFLNWNAPTCHALFSWQSSYQKLWKSVCFKMKFCMQFRASWMQIHLSIRLPAKNNAFTQTGSFCVSSWRLVNEKGEYETRVHFHELNLMDRDGMFPLAAWHASAQTHSQDNHSTITERCFADSDQLLLSNHSDSPWIWGTADSTPSRKWYLQSREPSWRTWKPFLTSTYHPNTVIWSNRSHWNFKISPEWEIFQGKFLNL